MTDSALTSRIEALGEALDIVRPHLPAARLESARAVTDRARERLGHGTENTIVALVGPTGAGKSTLFNGLCGEAVSTTGVRRPTTSQTHACVWGDSNGGVLDWLGVSRRHHVATDSGGAAARLDGLILLDLPDFDSTVVEHRIEVDRIIELVDLMVWVTDPQKYADELFLDDYVASLAPHGEVMAFVLNKLDTVAPDQHEAIVSDLESRLATAGIDRATILGVASADGALAADGRPPLAALRQLIVDVVTAKHAVLARVGADVTGAARDLLSPRSPGTVPTRMTARLADEFAEAAGVDIAASLAGEHHRREGRRAMAWPPVRWLRGRGRSPMADLRRAGATATSSAQIASALREFAESSSAGLDPDWIAAARMTTASTQPAVERGLATVTASLERATEERPLWWRGVAWLQTAVAASAAAGLLWLGVVAVLGGLLRLATDPLLVDTPGIDWIPLPSFMLVGGVAVGFLISRLVRVPLEVSARRRAARVRRTLRRQVQEVAAESAVAPLEGALEDHRRAQALLRAAAG